MANVKVSAEAMLALEHPLVKVPSEQIKKVVRNSLKVVEKEVGNLQTGCSDLAKKIMTAKDANAYEECIKTVDALGQKIQSLKRKLDEAHKEEATYAERCRLRIDHLNEVSNFKSVESPDYIRWNKLRLERILIDYMLRNGLYMSASSLARDSGISPLVDIELFAAVGKVEQALKRRSCAECLAWCNDNKSSLRKIKSTLEFNLRLQEYIELVRSFKLMEAIAYSKKHLVPWSETHLKEIQRAMGLLAFRPGTKVSPYKEMFEDDRWGQLIEQFKQDNFTLHSLTQVPVMFVNLQAGLAALKTKQCYQRENKNANCPICNDLVGQLAEKLPCSHHVNSTLVCRITGSLLDENNPPMVLPNGRVYSMNSLKEMAAKNGGMVTCSRTNERFDFSEAQKAYISTEPTSAEKPDGELDELTENSSLLKGVAVPSAPPRSSSSLLGLGRPTAPSYGSVHAEGSASVEAAPAVGHHQPDRDRSPSAAGILSSGRNQPKEDDYDGDGDDQSPPPPSHHRHRPQLGRENTSLSVDSAGEEGSISSDREDSRSVFALLISKRRSSSGLGSKGASARSGHPISRRQKALEPHGTAEVGGSSSHSRGAASSHSPGLYGGRGSVPAVGYAVETADSSQNRSSTRGSSRFSRLLFPSRAAYTGGSGGGAAGGEDCGEAGSSSSVDPSRPHPAMSPLARRSSKVVGDGPASRHLFFPRPELVSRAKAFGSSSHATPAEEIVAEYPASSFFHPNLTSSYPSNSVTSARYTWYTFLPLQLFSQFSKVANLYFLFIAALQLVPGWSPTGRFTTLSPLLIFTSLAMLREAWDDYKRHRQDAEENNAPVQILLPGPPPIPSSKGGKGERGGAAQSGLVPRPSTARLLGSDGATTVANANASASGPSPGVSILRDPCEVCQQFSERDAIENVATENGNGKGSAAPPSSAAQWHWGTRNWKELRVGDIVRIHEDEPIPADMVVLSSVPAGHSGDPGTCYIETASLDGETNLKMRNALKQTQWAASSISKLVSCKGHMATEAPNNKLYEFDGYVEIVPDYEPSDSSGVSTTAVGHHEYRKLPLTVNQILLRGSKLRNVHCVHAVVVFTGDQTKIRLNSKAARTKAPKSDQITNSLVMVVFSFLVILTVVFTVSSSAWEKVYLPGAWFLSGIGGETAENTAAKFFGYIILFNTFIPISLYVTLEMVKLAQIYFISQDEDMYHRETDTPAQCRTSSLNEDLGQVCNVFSDKTGTLTENLMLFRGISIGGGMPYFHDSIEAESFIQSRVAFVSQNGVNRAVIRANPRPSGGAKPAKSRAKSVISSMVPAVASPTQASPTKGQDGDDEEDDEPAEESELFMSQRASRRSTRRASSVAYHGPPTQNLLEKAVLRWEAKTPMAGGAAAASPQSEDSVQLDAYRHEMYCQMVRAMALTHTVVISRKKAKSGPDSSGDSSGLVSAAAASAVAASRGVNDPVGVARSGSKRSKTQDASATDGSDTESSRGVRSRMRQRKAAKNARAKDRKRSFMDPSNMPMSDYSSGPETSAGKDGADQGGDPTGGDDDDDDDDEEEGGKAVDAPHGEDHKAGEHVPRTLEEVSRSQLRLRHQASMVTITTESEVLGNGAAYSWHEDIVYEASSPDEYALVTAARELGCALIARSGDQVILDSIVPAPADYASVSGASPPGTSAAAARGLAESYTLLAVLEFSSKRKRMSTLYRCPDGRLRLFCKGADNVVLARLDPQDPMGVHRGANSHLSGGRAALTELQARAAYNDTVSRIDTFAAQGLRTLMYAVREVSPSEYEEWKETFTQASVAVDHRAEKLEAAAESLERGFHLLGITAIEDKLQDGVPETIEMLRLAGIRTWVLTGDKRETAINIGLSCNIIRPNSSVYILSESSPDDAVSLGEAIGQVMTEEELITEEHRLARNMGKRGGWQSLMPQAWFRSSRRRRAGVGGAPGKHQMVASSGSAAAAVITTPLQLSVPQRIRNTARAVRLGAPITSSVAIIHGSTAAGGAPCATTADPAVKANGSTTPGGGGDNGAQNGSAAAAAEVTPHDKKAHNVLVVDGACLARIEADEDLEDHLFVLARQVDSVIVCRATPFQKAMVVKGVRQRFPSEVTLAIGDGANDVSMILEAHVGVGITGREGLQAARSSDFSIAQFRYLQRLIFVHGHWNYVRLSRFILVSFWKCIAFYLTQAYYQIFTGFSGTSLYEPWTLAVYNLFFTSLPILFVGAFDQSVHCKILLANPPAYRVGMRDELYNFKLFAMYFFHGFYHAAALLFIPLTMYGLWYDSAGPRQDDALLPLGTMIYTSVVIAVNIKVVFIESWRWPIITQFVFLGTTLFWFAYQAAFSAFYPAVSLGEDNFAIFENIAVLAQYWLLIPVVVVATLLPEVAYKVAVGLFSPTDTHILREEESLQGLRKKDEEEDRIKRRDRRGRATRKQRVARSAENQPQEEQRASARA